MKAPVTFSGLPPALRTALQVSLALLFVLAGYIFAQNPAIGLAVAAAFAFLYLALTREELVLYAITALLVVALDEVSNIESPESLIFRLNIGRVYLMEFAVYGLLAVHVLKQLSRREAGEPGSIFVCTPLDRPLLAFALLLPVYGLYGLAQGNPFQYAVGYHEWRSLFLAILFYFLVVAIVKTAEEAKRLFWWFFSLVALKALAFLILYFLHIERTLPLVFGAGLVGAGPENYMLVFAALAGIAMLSFKIERNLSVRAFVLLAVLVLVANLVLSSKRNPQMFLACGIIALAWVVPRKARFKWAAAMFGVVIAFSLVTVLTPKKTASDVQASLSRYGEIGESLRSGTLTVDETGSLAFHVYDIFDGWEAVKQRPLIGYGFGGQFKRSYTALRGVMGPEVPAGMMHDQYLHFWWKMGLPGLVVFLWMIIGYLRVGYRQIPGIPSPEGRAIAWGLHSAMWGFAAAAIWCADFVGDTKVPFVICFSMALVVCLARNQRRVAADDTRGSR